VLALSTGFGLFFFSKLAYALGASASIPLALSTGAPSLIAITCSIFILLHYEDG
jgi:lipopolysaccharide export system permease protein